MSHAAEEACSLWNLLPRILSRMSNQDRTAAATGNQDQHVSEMEALLQAEGVDMAPDDCANETEWKDLIEELMGFRELSHAEVNRKRKRLTFASFQDVNMVSKIIATEALVEPNMKKMRTLLSKTSAIVNIPRLPDVAKHERESLKSKWRGRINLLTCHSGLAVLSLEFGLWTIDQYVRGRATI